MERKIFITREHELQYDPYESVDATNVKRVVEVSVNSDEFAYKMMAYIGGNFTDNEQKQLRDCYFVAKKFVDEEKAWNKFDNEIKPMLRKRADTKGLWYETWIDLEETWLDRWFSGFKYLSNDAICDACAKYLNDQERFYCSKSYIDMLNDMLRDAK